MDEQAAAKENINIILWSIQVVWPLIVKYTALLQ